MARSHRHFMLLCIFGIYLHIVSASPTKQFNVAPASDGFFQIVAPTINHHTEPYLAFGDAYETWLAYDLTAYQSNAVETLNDKAFLNFDFTFCGYPDVTSGAMYIFWQKDFAYDAGASFAALNSLPTLGNAVQMDYVQFTGNWAPQFTIRDAVRYALTPGNSGILTFRIRTQNVAYNCSSVEAGAAKAINVTFQSVPPIAALAKIHSCTECIRDCPLHHTSCGWCQPLAGLGSCLEGVRGSSLPSYGASCPGTFNTTFCPGNNSMIVNAVATATVANQFPNADLQTIASYNLGFLSFSTALNYYKSAVDRTRVYYEFDLAGLITYATTNILMRIPTLDTYYLGSAKFTFYPDMSIAGMTWSSGQPDAQAQARSWSFLMDLAPDPNKANGDGGFYQIDLGYPVKYMNSTKFLFATEVDPLYTTSYRRFNGWSGVCAASALVPHIYLDHDQYDDSGWNKPVTCPVTRGTCADCLMNCNNFLGLCGWCDETQECTAGSAQLYNCSSGWYFDTCPDATIKTVYAHATRKVLNPYTDPYNPGQYEIPNFVVNASSPIPVFEESVTYFHFDLSALVGQSVDQATFLINRAESITYTKNSLLNRFGWWWLDIRNADGSVNTTLDSYEFNYFHTKPRTLIFGEDYCSVLMRPLDSQDVAMLVKSTLKQSEPELIIAVSSQCEDDFFGPDNYFFPTASPRLVLKMGPTEDASSLTATTCDGCVNNCRLPFYNCGFCATTRKCYEGDRYGPFNNYTCPTGWYFASCPPDPILASETKITILPYQSSVFIGETPNTNYKGVANLPMRVQYDNHMSSLSHYFLVQFDVTQFRNANYSLLDAHFQMLTGDSNFWMASEEAIAADVYQIQLSQDDASAMNFGENSAAHPRVWIDSFTIGQRCFPAGTGKSSWSLTSPIGEGGPLLRAIYRAMADGFPLILMVVPQPVFQNFEFYGPDNLMNQLSPKLILTKGNVNSQPTFATACTIATTCADCIRISALCGWCDSAGYCAAGTAKGPSRGYCSAAPNSWFRLDCPLDYMRPQPYTHATYLSAAYNMTMGNTNQPATLVRDDFTLPQGPMAGAPIALQAGTIQVGVIWDYRMLPPEINIDNIGLTDQYFTISRAQAFAGDSLARVQGIYGQAVQLNFGAYQGNPASVNWGGNSQDAFSINTPPLFIGSNGVVSGNGYMPSGYSPTNENPIFGVRFYLLPNGTNSLALLGSLESSDKMDHPLMYIQTGITLTLQQDCAAYTDPCACVQNGTCGWCDNPSGCMNGADAEACRASADGQLYVYTLPCPDPTKTGDYGYFIPDLTTSCVCKGCDNGTVGTGKGCKACPPGTNSSDPILPCAPCSTGFYQPSSGATNCTVCSDYAAGAKCDGEGLTTPNGLQPGYGGCCQRQAGIKPCAVPEACPGGTCHCPDILCAAGYTGDYCDQCVKTPYPYHRVSPGNTCEPCPQLSVLFIIIAVLLVIVLCAVLIRYGKAISRNLTSLSIGLSYTQSIGLLRSFSFTLSQELVAYVKALSATNLDPDLFNTECAFPTLTFGTGFAIRVLLPVAVGVGLLLAYYIVKLHSFIIQRTVVKFRTNHQHLVRERDMTLRGAAKLKEWLRWQLVRFTTKHLSKIELSSYKSRIISAFVTFLVLAYLFTTQTALSVFACIHGADGTSRLSADVSVTCSGPAYEQLKIAAIVCLIVYTAGLPIIFLAILWINRVDAQLEDEKFLMRYGMLFSRYKPGRFYWEIAIMLRKFLIGACAIFAPVLQPHYGTAIIVIMGCAVSVVIQSIARPFKFVQHNFLETALIVLYILCMITASAASNGGNIAVMNGALFIFISLGVFLVVAVLVFDIVDATLKLMKRSPRAQACLGGLGLKTGDDDTTSTTEKDGSSTTSGSTTPKSQRVNSTAGLDDAMESGVALQSMGTMGSMGSMGSFKKALPPTPPPVSQPPQPPPQSRKPSLGGHSGSGGVQANPVVDGPPTTAPLPATPPPPTQAPPARPVSVAARPVSTAAGPATVGDGDSGSSSSSGN